MSVLTTGNKMEWQIYEFMDTNWNWNMTETELTLELTNSEGIFLHCYWEDLYPIFGAMSL